jgi:hypothetical protein
MSSFSLAASSIAVCLLVCTAHGQDRRDAAAPAVADRCGDGLDGLWHGFARHFFPAPPRSFSRYRPFDSHHGAFYATSDVFLWIRRVDGVLQGSAMVRSWGTTDGDSTTPECGPDGWNTLLRLTLDADVARGPLAMVNDGDLQDSIEYDCGDEHRYADYDLAQIRTRGYYRFDVRHSGVDTLEVIYRQGVAHVSFFMRREACSRDTRWP